jgi:hypothetical protein
MPGEAELANIGLDLEIFGSLDIRLRGQTDVSLEEVQEDHKNRKDKAKRQKRDDEDRRRLEYLESLNKISNIGELEVQETGNLTKTYLKHEDNIQNLLDDFLAINKKMKLDQDQKLTNNASFNPEVSPPSIPNKIRTTNIHWSVSETKSGKTCQKESNQWNT